MKIHYVETNEIDEFETEERCHIIELFNEPNDRSQSIARARVEPGVTTAWHRLKNTSEVYYIVSGEGEAEVGVGNHQKMLPHSLIKIPAKTAQRIKNTGAEDLVFLCFCVPGFSADAYEAL